MCSVHADSLTSTNSTTKFGLLFATSDERAARRQQAKAATVRTTTVGGDDERVSMIPARRGVPCVVVTDARRGTRRPKRSSQTGLILVSNAFLGRGGALAPSECTKDDSTWSTRDTT